MLGVSGIMLDTQPMWSPSVWTTALKVSYPVWGPLALWLVSFYTALLFLSSPPSLAPSILNFLPLSFSLSSLLFSLSPNIWRRQLSKNCSDLGTRGFVGWYMAGHGQGGLSGCWVPGTGEPALFALPGSVRAELRGGGTLQGRGDAS